MSKLEDICPICGSKVNIIGLSMHLRLHNLSIKELCKDFTYRRWYEEFRKNSKEERKKFSPLCLEFYERKYPNLSQEERITLWKEHCEKRRKISSETAIKLQEKNKKIPNYYKEKGVKDKETSIINIMFKENVSREEAEALYRSKKDGLGAPHPKFWIKLGFTEEEAWKKVSDYNKTHSKRCKEYWVKRGYTEEDASDKVSDIQREIAFSSPHTKGYYKKKNLLLDEDIGYLYNIKHNKLDERLVLGGFEDLELTDSLFEILVQDSKLLKEYIKKFKETRGKLRNPKTKKEYYASVWYYTHLNKKLVEGIESRSFTMCIDHIFSILEGYKQKIPPEIIGSPINLRMLSRSDNSKKRDRCDMTKEELFKKYEDWINESKI